MYDRPQKHRVLSLPLISHGVTAELDQNVPNHWIGHLFLRVDDKNQGSTGILHILSILGEKKKIR